jgi:hypothetical protein
LVINGVEWQLSGIYYNDGTAKAHYKFNLRHFLGHHAKDMSAIEIEEIIPKTPYLAIRIRKTYAHKGKVKWFDLNTGGEVSSKVINKIKAI